MINEYLAPGTYTANDTNHIVVVCDVVNHTWNGAQQMQEAQPPIVVYREVIEGKLHVRYSMSLDLFKTKFTAVDQKSFSTDELPLHT